jgi:hypothetical protein
MPLPEEQRKVARAAAIRQRRQEQDRQWQEEARNARGRAWVLEHFAREREELAWESDELLVAWEGCTERASVRGAADAGSLSHLW